MADDDVGRPCLIPSLVLVASEPIADGEEIFLNYRLSPAVRPDWYQVGLHTAISKPLLSRTITGESRSPPNFFTDGFDGTAIKPLSSRTTTGEFSSPPNFPRGRCGA
eukprot:8165841-Pyramimonas_sp.AAC.1